jgi:hypothetical protein
MVGICDYGRRASRRCEVLGLVGLGAIAAMCLAFYLVHWYRKG